MHYNVCYTQLRYMSQRLEETVEISEFRLGTEPGLSTASLRSSNNACGLVGKRRKA